MSQQNQQEPGSIQFFDNEVPGLAAGQYNITATLTLPNADTDNYTTQVSQQFEVQGPRFGIDPSEVHAMFPDSNSNGYFSFSLPNIILENPVLPWERNIVGDTTIPWMALLVFKSDEVEVNPTTNSPLITSSVQEFLAPETGVLKPAIALSSVSTELLLTSMTSLRIPTAVFQAVTPRLIELAVLASVRRIDPQHQVVSGGVDDGKFSMILANRFPNSSNPLDDSGAHNYAHLVSLEGWSDYLIDSPQWPTGITQVQLVSLASWTFISANQPGQTFPELAQGLVTTTPSQMLLNIPVSDDGSAAAARLIDGFTALSYHTLPGPDTFSWYRGPFAAAPAQPLPSSITTYNYASSGKIYDQANAVFDNSYASAWSIGRLAALADPVFANGIQNTRNKVAGINARLLERSKMPHLAGITDLASLTAPGLTRKFFSGKVKAGMGDTLNNLFSAPSTGNTFSNHKTNPNYLYPNEPMPASEAMQARWLMQKPEVSRFLATQVDEDLDPLALWLADLALLHAIPFNHLVPDQRMLPVESLRFFYVDQGWIKVLLDGAMSVGVHGTKENMTNEVIAAPLYQRTLQRATQKRSKLLRRQAEDTTVTPQLPVAGMLLRSALVSGWPGLAVQATANGVAVNIMRMDRVAPDILLVLWDSIPDSVTLSQPDQGLTFGILYENTIMLPRSLSADNLGQQLGFWFPVSGSFSQFIRPVQNHIGGQVLNLIPAVNDTPGYLIPALSAALSMPANITASEFAIEMVKAPMKIVFSSPDETPTNQ